MPSSKPRTRPPRRDLNPAKRRPNPSRSPKSKRLLKRRKFQLKELLSLNLSKSSPPRKLRRLNHLQRLLLRKQKQRPSPR